MAKCFVITPIGETGELKKNFQNAVKAANSQDSVDNPVVRAIIPFV